MSAVGTMFISQKIVPAKFEATFFGLLLVPIAGFYLAFTSYYGADAAWSLELGAVIAFALLGGLGTIFPASLIAGFALHGVWDLLHEIHARSGLDVFGGRSATEIPLAYGVFCAVYDWCMAAYFYARFLARRDQSRRNDG